MTTPRAALTPSPSSQHAGDAATPEVDQGIGLHSDERTVVTRQTGPSGISIIRKQAIGVDAVKRLQHERQILQKLHGVAGITQLADSDGLADELHLIDEGGIRLDEASSQAAFSMDEVIDLALQLSRMLAAVHQRGIVHKDINPSNILLIGEPRRPLLIDFNIASGAAQERTGFTHQSQIDGTLAYMAPEQTGRSGRTVDLRADLYALGATLYELCAGRKAFESTDLLELVHAHLVHVPPAPHTVNAAVPKGLSDIVMHLLEKEPDQRYQSAEGLMHDLALLQSALARGELVHLEVGMHDFPAHLSPPSHLIGRDAEIATLQAALAQAAQGHSSVMLINGQAGMGKSSLLHELRPMVTKRRGWFVNGKFDQYRRDSRAAAVQALRSLGQLLLAESDADLARHRDKIRESLGVNLGIGPCLLPEFQLLLGDMPAVDISDPAVGQTRLLQATVDLLRAIASPERPLVFVLDDLQWAPTVSLRFLDGMITAAHSVPGMLLVGTYRDADVDALHPLSAMMARWSNLGVMPHTVHLQKLPDDSMAQLIAEVLRLPIDEALRLNQALHERTDGNPYDTVELINALRDDGLLKPSAKGWTWDDAQVQGHVSRGNVVDMLTRRIDKLPDAARALLEAMACLGGEVARTVLATAAFGDQAQFEASLALILQDGFLIATHAPQAALLTFSHDRVQQAVLNGMDRAHREATHLTLGRRLLADTEHAALAAEQLLYAEKVITDHNERRQIANLFRDAANRVSGLNNAVCERFLAAAMRLLKSIETPDDGPALIRMAIDRHKALYSLARFDEADALYATLSTQLTDPVQRAEAAAVQVASLAIRARHADALDFGLHMLAQTGLNQPVDVQAALNNAVGNTLHWVAKLPENQDLTCPQAEDPIVLAQAALLMRTATSAFFTDPKVYAWLTLEAHRLWMIHGPCAPLLAAMRALPVVLVGPLQNHQAAYAAAQHMLRVGEARGYVAATAMARFTYGNSAAVWFHPLEACISTAHQAHGALTQCGELQYASFTFNTSVPALTDCAPSLDTVEAEVNKAMNFIARSGIDRRQDSNLPYLQLLRSLRGETRSPGSFTDDTFSEAGHAAWLVGNQTLLAANFHVTRGISALIFGDHGDLVRHADAAMSLLPRVPGFYNAALAHLLQALSCAERMRQADTDAQRQALLPLFKTCREWLARRAADAPDNFRHLLHWVDAERAWAFGDIWTAGQTFDAAIKATQSITRPWHMALITERAALFHISLGMVDRGRPLLAHAKDLYTAWGASSKAYELARTHPFLRSDLSLRLATSNAANAFVPTDVVDMVAVLRASQAISSQPHLERLQSTVAHVLGAMTGATQVNLVVRPDNVETWSVLTGGEGPDANPSVEEAAARGLLPLSAFLYTLRTRQPLLIDDATQDDRFANDPALQNLHHCSLLLVPVMSHGDMRAVLVLENRQRQGAFSNDRLDALTLIAGQLSVSLDNALLYASLERKVAERTVALQEANQRLELLSQTDGLTGLANRRHFDETLQAEWLRARRTGSYMGLVLIDIDHFKRYNDYYGHQAGDECLRRVAHTMRAGRRTGIDLVARYGGEEFVLILPHTDLDGTLIVAERVRAAIAELNMPHIRSEHGLVSISVGATSFVPTFEQTPDQYITSADEALYEAKRTGRNVVRLAPP